MEPIDPYLAYLISIALIIWTLAATVFVWVMVWILMNDNEERAGKSKPKQKKKTYPPVVREWFEMQELEFEDRMLISPRQ